MLRRAAVLVALPLACAACANEPSPYRLGGPANASEVMAPPPAEFATRRKTVSDNIFAALALERVTGRKPDPGRLLTNR